MFNVVFIVFACKNKDAPVDSVWKTCPTQSRSWNGVPDSEFGFRLQAAEEQVWITAPQDCDTPLYILEEEGINPQSWSLENCTDRVGQEITVNKNDVWLYAPIQQQWLSMNESTSVNGRRLSFTPTDKKVLLTDSSLTIGEVIHPLPKSAIDLTLYGEIPAVLLRGLPTQIWTEDGIHIPLRDADDRSDEQIERSLYNRIHPFLQDVNGKNRWVLGGGEQLTYLQEDTLYTVSLPHSSILQSDISEHHRISMGYASSIGNYDNDVHLDWIVGAPTAGSGQTLDFPEQAGWVGWFERVNGSWILQKEWVGSEAFAHLGMSVSFFTTPTERRIIAGSPGLDQIDQLHCLQKD